MITDYVNSNLAGLSFTTANVSSATTFNIPNSYRGTLFIYDSTPARNGEYMVYAAGTGGVNYKSISSATDITIDISVSNKLTITPASGSRIVVFLNAQFVATV